MPLEPLERVVVLTQYKKLSDCSECIKTLGHRMSKIGRLPESQMLDLFEALREKNKALENMVLELIEKGTLTDTTGAGQTLIDLCCREGNHAVTEG